MKSYVDKQYDYQFDENFDGYLFKPGTRIKFTLREKDSGNLLKIIDINTIKFQGSPRLEYKLFDHIYFNNLDIFINEFFGSCSWRGTKRRFVYYDEITGQVKEILSQKNVNSKFPYVRCRNEKVEKIISGRDGINDYIVCYRRDLDKTVFMKKDNIIRLRTLSNELYKIPFSKDLESDLNLVYYEDNILEVNLDVTKIAPLFQTDSRDGITFEEGTEIRIVIKEKNSGNLLKELVIDAQDLLESGQMFFTLYDHIYTNNVEFFTYKTLTSYSWCIGKVKLISPVKERIKFNIHKADHKVKYKGFSYHLVVKKPEKDRIKIVNNIESLNSLRIYDQIEFFIVDKHDPNILYEKFALTRKDLLEKFISVKLDFDFSDKTILYNHKFISVLIEE